jgi:hypothetical protein
MKKMKKGEKTTMKTIRTMRKRDIRSGGISAENGRFGLKSSGGDAMVF